jgi:hypothetical protein
MITKQHPNMVFARCQINQIQQDLEIQVAFSAIITRSAMLSVLLLWGGCACDKPDYRIIIHALYAVGPD